MAWTKQTKETSTPTVDGWGDLAWGSGSWGSPAGTSWTKRADVTDTWFVRGVLYDGGSLYDSDTLYNSGIEIESWTKVPDAI